MPNFNQTVRPTPFSFFDDDTDFQTEADAMVTFVKRSLGDDVLSVELSRKQIWAQFELAVCEYSRHIHELRTKNDLIKVLGLPTGTTDLTNKYPRESLEFLTRLAEPYGTMANVGGSHNQIWGYFNIEIGKQDYDLYTELKVFNGPHSGSLVIDALPSGSKGKLRVQEVMHFEPMAAQSFLLNASNITNFLATNFNYESYTNASVFYVLPVFEDVLRRGMIETAFRVRRSNYSWKVVGTKLRIFPMPTGMYHPDATKLFVTVAPVSNPLVSGDANDLTGIAYTDESIYGVSGPSNIPLSNLPFNTITDPGRQWIRLYTLALCKELLGLVRSKFQTIPIPGADLQLNGSDLVSQGREDQKLLVQQLIDFLNELTYDKITSREATIAENLQKQLRMMPIPNGGAITIG